jgi:hypothetical protein
MTAIDSDGTYTEDDEGNWHLIEPAIITRIADPADERVPGVCFTIARPASAGSYIIDVTYLHHRDTFAVGINMIDPATKLAERSTSISSHHKDRGEAERAAVRLDSIMQRAIEHAGRLTP